MAPIFFFFFSDDDDIIKMKMTRMKMMHLWKKDMGNCQNRWYEGSATSQLVDQGKGRARAGHG